MISSCRDLFPPPLDEEIFFDVEVSNAKFIVMARALSGSRPDNGIGGCVF
jgi:hypothetical protein